jgi:hypothetical protein
MCAVCATAAADRKERLRVCHCRSGWPLWHTALSSALTSAGDQVLLLLLRLQLKAAAVPNSQQKVKQRCQDKQVCCDMRACSSAGASTGTGRNTHASAQHALQCGPQHCSLRAQGSAPCCDRYHSSGCRGSIKYQQGEKQPGSQGTRGERSHRPHRTDTQHCPLYQKCTQYQLEIDDFSTPQRAPREGNRNSGVAAGTRTG